MPIHQNIARKQGTINPHPFKNNISTRVFGMRGSAGANVGDATNPTNPAYLTAVGKDYNAQISHTGGATNPVGSHSDTATQLYVPPLIAQAVPILVHQSQARQVGPQEKGKFFSSQTAKETAIRVSGGVDPNSNTSFHPKTMTVTRQQRYPVKESTRLSPKSFATGRTMTGYANMDMGARWSQVKRSASDNFVPTMGRSTQAGPGTGNVVGSGTTGTTATRGRLGVTVNQNVHSGSPFVVAWVPNPRRGQPNERGNTNPLKMKCVAKACAGLV